MEELLPSEIARLVFGYIEEDEGCGVAAKQFLESSQNLRECHEVSKRGGRVKTRVEGYNLSAILQEYCAVQRLVAARCRGVEHLRHQGGLVERLELLLAHAAERAEAAPPPDRITTSFPRSRDAVPTLETPAKRVSFHDGLVSPPLPSLSTPPTKRKCPSSAVKRNTSLSPMGQSIMSTMMMPNKVRHKTGSEEGDSNGSFDFTAVQQAFLGNKLHQRIAENINRALHSGHDGSAGFEPGPPACEGDNMTSELDQAIKSIVVQTEQDPLFERFLDEIIFPFEDEQQQEAARKEGGGDVPLKRRLRSARREAGGDVQSSPLAQREAPPPPAVVPSLEDQNNAAIQFILGASIAGVDEVSNTPAKMVASAPTPSKPFGSTPNVVTPAKLLESAPNVAASLNYNDLVLQATKESPRMRVVFDNGVSVSQPPPPLFAAANHYQQQQQQQQYVSNTTSASRVHIMKPPSIADIMSMPIVLSHGSLTPIESLQTINESSQTMLRYASNDGGYVRILPKVTPAKAAPRARPPKRTPAPRAKAVRPQRPEAFSASSTITITSEAEGCSSPNMKRQLLSALSLKSAASGILPPAEVSLMDPGHTRLFSVEVPTLQPADSAVVLGLPHIDTPEKVDNVADAAPSKSASLARLSLSKGKREDGGPAAGDALRLAAASTNRQVAAPSDQQAAAPSNQQVVTPSIQQATSSSNRQVSASSNIQAAASLNKQATLPSNQQVTASSNQEVATSSNQSVATSSIQQVVPSSNQQVATSSSQQVATSSIQQVATSSSQQVATSSDRQVAGPSGVKRPRGTPLGGKGAKRLSLSTPRRVRSHVRALDFTTPPKYRHSPRRRAITSPKGVARRSPGSALKFGGPFKSPPAKRVRSSLFQSPDAVPNEATLCDEGSLEDAESQKVIPGEKEVVAKISTETSGDGELAPTPKETRGDKRDVNTASAATAKSRPSAPIAAKPMAMMNWSLTRLDTPIKAPIATRAPNQLSGDWDRVTGVGCIFATASPSPVKAETSPAADAPSGAVWDANLRALLPCHPDPPRAPSYVRKTVSKGCRKSTSEDENGATPDPKRKTPRKEKSDTTEKSSPGKRKKKKKSPRKRRIKPRDDKAPRSVDERLTKKLKKKVIQSPTNLRASKRNLVADATLSHSTAAMDVESDNLTVSVSIREKTVASRCILDDLQRPSATSTPSTWVPSLLTPLKDDSSNTVPMTPRLLSPGADPDTPVTRLIRGDPLFDCSMIPTPFFCLTPGGDARTPDSGSGYVSTPVTPGSFLATPSYFEPRSDLDRTSTETTIVATNEEPKVKKAVAKSTTVKPEATEEASPEDLMRKCLLDQVKAEVFGNNETSGSSTSSSDDSSSGESCDTTCSCSRSTSGGDEESTRQPAVSALRKTPRKTPCKTPRKTPRKSPRKKPVTTLDAKPSPKGKFSKGKAASKPEQPQEKPKPGGNEFSKGKAASKPGQPQEKPKPPGGDAEAAAKSPQRAGVKARTSVNANLDLVGDLEAKRLRMLTKLKDVPTLVKRKPQRSTPNARGKLAAVSKAKSPKKGATDTAKVESKGVAPESANRPAPRGKKTVSPRKPLSVIADELMKKKKGEKVGGDSKDRPDARTTAERKARLVTVEKTKVSSATQSDKKQGPAMKAESAVNRTMPESEAETKPAAESVLLYNLLVNSKSDVSSGRSSGCPSFRLSISEEEMSPARGRQDSTKHSDKTLVERISPSASKHSDKVSAKEISASGSKHSDKVLAKRTRDVSASALKHSDQTSAERTQDVSASGSKHSDKVSAQDILASGSKHSEKVSAQDISASGSKHSEKVSAQDISASGSKHSDKVWAQDISASGSKHSEKVSAEDISASGSKNSDKASSERTRDVSAGNKKRDDSFERGRFTPNGFNEVPSVVAVNRSEREMCLFVTYKGDGPVAKPRREKCVDLSAFSTSFMVEVETGEEVVRTCTISEFTLLAGGRAPEQRATRTSPRKGAERLSDRNRSQTRRSGAEGRPNESRRSPGGKGRVESERSRERDSSSSGSKRSERPAERDAPMARLKAFSKYVSPLNDLYESVGAKVKPKVDETVKHKTSPKALADRKQADRTRSRDAESVGRKDDPKARASPKRPEKRKSHDLVDPNVKHERNAKPPQTYREYLDRKNTLDAEGEHSKHKSNPKSQKRVDTKKSRDSADESSKQYTNDKPHSSKKYVGKQKSLNSDNESSKHMTNTIPQKSHKHADKRKALNPEDDSAKHNTKPLSSMNHVDKRNTLNPENENSKHKTHTIPQKSHKHVVDKRKTLNPEDEISKPKTKTSRNHVDKQKSPDSADESSRRESNRQTDRLADRQKSLDSGGEESSKHETNNFQSSRKRVDSKRKSLDSGGEESSKRKTNRPQTSRKRVDSKRKSLDSGGEESSKHEANNPQTSRKRVDSKRRSPDREDETSMHDTDAAESRRRPADEISRRREGSATRGGSATPRDYDDLMTYAIVGSIREETDESDCSALYSTANKTRGGVALPLKKRKTSSATADASDNSAKKSRLEDPQALLKHVDLDRFLTALHGED